MTAVEQFQAQGYAVVPGALTAAEVTDARAESVEICRGRRGTYDGVVDGAAELSESALLGRYLAIHFPHKISPMFARTLRNEAVIELLTGLIGPDIKCMQSMLFIKAAGKPGQAWHQDEHFIPTRDRSLWGAWIALDEATIDNGCLWVLPGSHRSGVIWPTRHHGSPLFDDSSEAYGFPDDPDAAVALEVEPGDAVLFHGYLLHRSLPNRRTHGTRRAVVNHYMSAQSLLPWDWDGRLTRVDDMRDVVIVAGDDPYAYKGIDDLTFPYVRSEVADPAAPPDR